MQLIFIFIYIKNVNYGLYMANIYIYEHRLTLAITDMYYCDNNKMEHSCL